MRQIPSLNALRAFEAAARHQNFGVAADELCVTPGAISQQIKALESYLGLALFQKSGRRVVMTQEAQMLLPELREAFGLIQKSLSRLGDSETGLLTISTTLAFAAKWLLPRLYQFQAQYPDIDIRLDTNDRLTQFDQENVDASIRFGNGDYPGLKALPIKSISGEKIIPVCNPALLDGAQPLLKPQDLQFHTLLHDDTMLNSDVLTTWPKWLAWVGVTTVDAARGLHFSNSLLAIDAAISGQGVALGCEFVVKDDLRAGHLVQPFSTPCKLDYSYHLVFPDKRVNKKLEYFYQWLLEQCDK